MSTLKLCFLKASTPLAEKKYKELVHLFPSYSDEEADVIVVLGGDGFLLHTLHQIQDLDKPVFGLNCGSYGFLLNILKSLQNLQERIAKAEETILYPLKMEVKTIYHATHTCHAINEVSLLRQTSQTAKIRIQVDRKVRLKELICDGVLLSTPAGSTAYNFSAYGPILPLGANLLALTPISAFRPQRWRGALLPENVKVSFKVLEPNKRPVSATADDYEVRDILKVDIIQDKTIRYRLLFDPHHNLEDRIFLEQFMT